MKSFKRTKKKLKGLEAKILAAEIKLKDISKSNESDDGSGDNGNAGDDFGSSSEKSNKKRKS